MGKALCHPGIHAVIMAAQCGAERSPEGHPSPVPGSPRSVAEGRIRHDRSAPHSPRSEAEGGTK
jgi:hypothetical protein